MTATDTVQGVENEAVELWVKSYQGEVFGEAYFDAVSALTSDPDERAKLVALAALERCTKELLEPPMKRLGISLAADPGLLEAVAATTEFNYVEMLEALPALAAEYLTCYARLRQLVEPEDIEVADLLIAHELALELFARRELAGDTATSLQPVHSLPHVTP